MDRSWISEFWGEYRQSGALSRYVDGVLSEDRVSEDQASLSLFGVNARASQPRRCRATITAEEPGVFCGGPLGLAIFEALDGACTRVHVADEGAAVDVGERVLVVDGDVCALLGGERSVLNTLGHLSGVATRVARWVELAAAIQVLDTRKTVPGLRSLQKYAVRCGGGVNHRANLAEFPMYKENHRDLFRQRGLEPGVTVDAEIAALKQRAAEYCPGLPVQIEVEDYASFEACIRHRVELILIDNQTPATTRLWIDQARRAIPTEWSSTLESSGGITDVTLSEYAKSGVTRISLGALTHSVRAFDVSLHVEWMDERR